MSSLKDKSDIDGLVKDLNILTVETQLDTGAGVSNAKEDQADDDGYDSSNSEDKETESLHDDEKVLEPLSFIPDPKPIVYILYNSRGYADCRYNPYSRPTDSHSSRNIPPVAQHGLEENFSVLKPIIRILKKGDTTNPSQFNATVDWTSKHELCIGRCQLPEDTSFVEQAAERKVQLFIQLNPHVKELKSFMADVKIELDSKRKRKKHFIGPIVIFLKTEVAESQEKYLLERTTMEERTDAYNLVEKKELNQLTCGIGPHKDTVLSVLCAQRNPKNPGQTFAQIHAVVKRLINHPDRRVRRTIFSVNNNQISAFEISAITNNSVVACYLAEIMYNMTDDVETALHTLNCADSQSNTIIHLLARKGDSNKVTLKSLLDMRLSDGSQMFSITPNSKQQYPIHIAAQSLTNQPETIRILYESMQKSFEMMDQDGMTALHYACQRTTDVELVQKILSYKKDNINVITKDGLSALDLISRRGTNTTPTLGICAIEKTRQEKIIKLLQNNGGTSGKQPAEEFFPIYAGNLHPGSSSIPTSACSVSSMGSPYSYQNSVGSPVNISDPFLNSVESYPQSSSPESSNHGSPHSLLSTPPSQGFLSDYPESPNSHQSYEDQLASEILTQFPEITNVLGQIFEEDQ